MSEKECRDCKNILPTSAFHRDKSRACGTRESCRRCRAAAAAAARTVVAEKTCSKCRRTKNASEFYASAVNAVDGRMSCCIQCKKETEKASPEKQRAKHHKQLLRKQWGMTPADYEEMKASQGGGCAICGLKIGADDRALNVDHSHATGRIRGLLCGNCNKGIGHLQDSPQLLEAAAKYLRGHELRSDSRVVPNTYSDRLTWAAKLN